jgi:hypothetical protein
MNTPGSRGERVENQTRVALLAVKLWLSRDGE